MEAIKLINGELQWSESYHKPNYPQVIRRKAYRPKTQRRKSLDEVSRTTTANMKKLKKIKD